MGIFPLCQLALALALGGVCGAPAVRDIAEKHDDYHEHENGHGRDYSINGYKVHANYGGNTAEGHDRYDNGAVNGQPEAKAGLGRPSGKGSNRSSGFSGGRGRNNTYYRADSWISGHGQPLSDGYGNAGWRGDYRAHVGLGGQSFGSPDGG